jgi:hypothetical protein
MEERGGTMRTRRRRTRRKEGHFCGVGPSKNFPGFP